jgi:SAM-dependent methyltransferase
MPKGKAFDIYYKEYDAWFVKNDVTYVSELRAIKGLLPESKSGVEIGVGTGRFGVHPGVGFGVDPSHEMARVSKDRGLIICEAVAEDLPFPDGTFDLVLMVTVICFFDDLDKALSEAHRILVPRGIIIIGFIDRESGLGQQYRIKRESSRFYRNANFYSAEEITHYLIRAGFHDFQFKQTLFRAGAPEIEEAKNGFGEGSFVVVRAKK